MNTNLKDYANREFNDEPPEGEEVEIYVDDISDRNRIEESLEENVNVILESVDTNYKRFINNLPDYKGLEDFLNTLPKSVANDIRKYAVENHIYGNQPLEQMLIMQYGAVIQAKSINQLNTQLEDIMERTAMKFLYKLNVDVESQIERIHGVQNDVVEHLRNMESSFEYAEEKRKLEMDNILIQAEQEYEKRKKLINQEMKTIEMGKIANILDIVKSKAKECFRDGINESQSERYKYTQVQLFGTAIGCCVFMSVFMLMALKFLK